MPHTQKKIVAVGLSGGVDSSVSAYLLKEQGHDVIGIYMQNWQANKDDPYCTAEQDLSDAKTICDTLHIPLHVVNFAEEYWERVFQHCLDAFAEGRTPNPDIGCNKEIKFKALLEHALSLGADYLATGHYAKIIFSNEQYQLHKAADLNKDQSYFLYTLGQKELAHSLFPLSNYAKPQVREIARQLNLLNFNKKDSTGICFIGERKFTQFLQEYLLTKPGLIKTPEGTVVGQHQGLMFYTIGQRKGLKIGGRKESNDSPWYVLEKDMANNILVVVQGAEHPRLYRSQLLCTQTSWVDSQGPNTSLSCSAKIRYRQADQTCCLIPLNNHQYEVTFTEPQRAITPGQSVVFYQGTECLGGGIIH